MTTKKATDATTRNDAQAPQAQERPQAEQSAAARATAPAAGSDAAVAAAPAPATQAAPPARDQHTGQGGLYRRNPDGTRTLIERTERKADDASANTQAG